MHYLLYTISDMLEHTSAARGFGDSSASGLSLPLVQTEPRFGHFCPDGARLLLFATEKLCTRP